MKGLLIFVALAVIVAFAILAFFAGSVSELDTEPTTTSWVDPSIEEAGPSADGYLYGRVTADHGITYEGRLRFGTTEEAFWDDHFNGYKATNPWANFVPPEKLTERVPIEIFGFEIASRTRQIDLERPFMVRFGDVSRIDVDGRDLRVTLRSGTVFDLDRFNADDIADGVRVWDAEGGDVDLVEWRIRSIEFLPTPQSSPQLEALPSRLYGTVRTAQDSFTGFVQWNRESCIGSDVLLGQTSNGEVGLRFDSIRSIARSSSDRSLVTLIDGLEVELSGTRAVGHRGVHVDDPRYGGVLVPWDAFERVDFRTATDTGPAYDDFQPSRPLTGTVTTRDGRRIGGRIVFDLDESETVETLDARAGGVNYSIPFGRIAWVQFAGDDAAAVLTLHDGGELHLERAGDLGDDNAGMLVFAGDDEPPDYVTWRDVSRIDFHRGP